MKHKIINILITMGICLAGLLSACDSKEEPASLITGDEAYLEVEVSEINPSRNIIEGGTLPDRSQYGICPVLRSSMNWIDNDSNVAVDFIEGKSIIGKDIAIPDNQEVAVYAYYPFKTGTKPTWIYVEEKTQTDYLWGRSEDTNGDLMFVTKAQPKAKIRFEHILARITLRVYREADNNKSYNIPSIALMAEGRNYHSFVMVNVINKSINSDVVESVGYTIPIYCTLSNNWLNETNDIIIANLLVLPVSRPCVFSFDFGNGLNKSVNLPRHMYESGKQYIYDCKVCRDGTLEISECDIEPWENTDMPEIETY